LSALQTRYPDARHGTVIQRRTSVRDAEPSSNVEQASATLNGTVNPNGSNVTDCHFEYGLTIAYGWNAPCGALPGAGATPVGVSAAAVSGLNPGNAYHYRIAATNTGGVSHGLDRTFNTLVEPSVTSTPNPSIFGTPASETTSTGNFTPTPTRSRALECGQARRMLGHKRA
jgi:hypothetical protein